MRKINNAGLTLFLLGVAPLLAADSPTVLSVPNPDTVPYTLDLGFFANIITVGHVELGVLPCFNCINGAGQLNLGLAAPLTVVHEGSIQNISLTGQNVSYSGPCTFSYSIRATLNSPPIQTNSVSGSCFPAIWLASFPITIPNAPGRYVLQGEIQTRGAKSVVMAGLVITQ